MIGFQVLVALPFICKKTTVYDYVTRAKFTGKGRVTPGEPFWDYVAAIYGHTIFWNWVSKECYEEYECLAVKLRISMLSLNVYHFFIRKWCWKQCLINLRDWFDPKYQYVHKPLKQKDINLTLEILVLGYVTGVVLMPGANQ